MVETRPCGCRSVTDGSGHVVMVGTCPLCLPAGAITWLIENGRQLDMFDLEPLEEWGVATSMRGRETNEITQVTPIIQPDDGLPF